MSTPKSFSLFLALRYLKPKRTFLSIITLISILGVTLGVMVLILVISVMTGFEQELQQKVIGFDAHIVVSNGAVLDDWISMQEEIHKIPGVEAVAPFALGPVLVQHQNRRMAPKIRGIDPDKEREVTDIKKYIIAGDYDLDGDKTVIGSELARQLNATVDKITVFSPGNMDDMLNELERVEKEGGKADPSVLRQMILPTELEVTGIFESGRYLYDSEFLVVPLHIGQEVYDLGGSVHGLAIRTSDPFKAEEIKRTINQMLGESAFAQTWIDMNKQIFDAIRMERNVMFFILMFIILVAAFGIMNTHRDYEGTGSADLPNHWRLSGAGCRGWCIRNLNRTSHRDCPRPVSQSGQRLALDDPGNRSFPEEHLSIQFHPCRDRAVGCRDHLHQCILYLLDCSLDPGLLRGKTRSGQSPALRISL
jgi:lipoprotein-releasing system permease protein